MEEVMEKAQVGNYPTYTDSDIDWLGKIPSHWKSLANKYIFTLRKNQVGKKSNEYKLLSLTLNGVIERDMDNPQGKFPAEFDTYQEVRKGDFIFCLFDVEETPRAVGLSSFEGMITGAYTVMSAHPGFNKQFLYYFYLNLDSDKRLRSLYKGLRNTIPKESFLSYKTLLPPIEEQTHIAAFLDRKTAQIDKAIRIKERQIELLKERRQILIQNAVTKGLDTGVKMKDSGVEYIGMVPEYWEVKRLNDVFDQIQTGTTPTTSNLAFFDGPISWYNPSDLNTSILGEAQRRITELAIKRNEAKLFPGNSILVVGIGATSGKTAYMTEPASFNQQITGFHSISQSNSYFYYQLQSMSSTMLSLANYTTLPILNNEFFKSLRLVVPPIHKQEEIVDFIQNLTTKFELAVDCKEKEIEKLKEYKATLIDGVVTGKVRVRL